LKSGRLATNTGTEDEAELPEFCPLDNHNPARRCARECCRRTSPSASLAGLLNGPLIDI
jgi:hypothetical protein